jgi:hypothetical protein
MPWGEYFVVPENLWEAIEETPWTRWSEYSEIKDISIFYIPLMHSLNTRIAAESLAPSGRGGVR